MSMSELGLACINKDKYNQTKYQRLPKTCKLPATVQTVEESCPVCKVLLVKEGKGTGNAKRQFHDFVKWRGQLIDQNFTLAMTNLIRQI